MRARTGFGSGVQGGVRAIRHAVRNPQIVALRRGGVPVNDIAWRFGISRRAVFRILAMDAERFDLRPVAALVRERREKAAV